MMDQSIIPSLMEVFANVLSGIRDDTSLYENNNNNNNNFFFLNELKSLLQNLN